MSEQSLQFKSGLDDSSFEAGLRRMEHAAKETGEKIGEHFAEMGKEIGGSIVAALTIEGAREGIEKLFEFTKGIHEASQELGMTTDQVQGLQGAFEHFGVSQEQINTGLAHFATKLQEARGSAEAMEKLAKMGISWDSVSTGNESKALAELSDHMKETGDAVRNLAYARELFGRGGAPFVGLLKQGSDAFEEHMNAVKKVSESDVAAIHDEEIALAELTRAIKVFATHAVVSVFGGIDPEGGFMQNGGGTDKEREAARKSALQRLLGKEGAEQYESKAKPEDVRAAAESAKATKEALKDKEALMKAGAELDKAQHAAMIESLADEEKLNALDEDRIKLEEEYVTSTAIRKIEIEKEILKIKQEQGKEEKRMAEDQKKIDEEHRREIEKTARVQAEARRRELEAQKAEREWQLQFATEEESAARQNLQDILSGHKHRETPAEKKMRRLMDLADRGHSGIAPNSFGAGPGGLDYTGAVSADDHLGQGASSFGMGLGGAQGVRFTRHGSGAALDRLHAAQQAQAAKQGDLTETNQLLQKQLEAVKEGLLGK